MKKEVKSDQVQTDTRNKTQFSKARDIQNLEVDRIKFLDRMMSALRPLRQTAKSHEFDFLSYLVEMAALEVQKEIHQAELERQ